MEKPEMEKKKTRKLPEIEGCYFVGMAGQMK
jgi:hypothetical protein